MEELKYLPPKFSYAMKDLTSFLGIFEISEEEIRQKRGNKSDSSNTSHIIQSGFKAKKSLEVVQEKDLDSDSEDLH